MGTLQQLGKIKERKLSARLQAVDGKWEGIQVQTETGRVGHLPEDQVPGDTLTRKYSGEAKSSSSKAKNPGHNITKGTLQKCQQGAKQLGQRWVYMVDLPYCEKGHMISEQQHFRYMVMEELLTNIFARDGRDKVELLSVVDAIIDERLQENCSESHR